MHLEPNDPQSPYPPNQNDPSSGEARPPGQGWSPQETPPWGTTPPSSASAQPSGPPPRYAPNNPSASSATPPPYPQQPPQQPPPGQGPPPPFPPPYAYYRQPPPPPPPRRGSVWQVLFALVVLFGLFVVGIVFIAAMLGGGSSVEEETPTLAGASGNSLAVVRIEGVIQPGEDMSFWTQSFKAIEKNKRVRGVVVRVNSPGGAVGTSQELYEMIKRLRDANKTVYISMGDVAASGGYYLSAAADRIYALNGTLTGSIGVIFSTPEISALAEKIGITENTVTSGKFKDAGSPFRPMKPEERALFDNLIQDTYNQFLDDVLAGRAKTIQAACAKLAPGEWTALLLDNPANKEPRDYLKSIADGRVLTGRQALKVGLVDEIGTFETVVRELGSELGIRGEPDLIEIRKKRGFLERLSASAGRFMPFTQSPVQFKMQLP